MQCKVNGKELELPDGLTVAELLDRLEIKPVKVAVEVDLEIVPKSLYGSRVLEDGVRVEVVSFVGGG